MAESLAQAVQESAALEEEEAAARTAPEVPSTPAAKRRRKGWGQLNGSESPFYALGRGS